MFGQGKKAYDLYTVQRGTKVERLNPNLPKQIRKALGTEREVLISAKEKDIEELQKSIREDQVIVEDENEDQQVRDRARERMADKQGQIDALENEREELEEGLPLRERVKNIFKKYGFTVTAEVLAVGTMIGVIVNSLSKGLKSVAMGIGNGLQTLGKKDSTNSPRSHRAYRQFHLQDCWISDQLPRKECLASHPWSCGFHG